MNVYVYGVGTTNFGKHPDVPLAKLAEDAVLEALLDAGPGAIEAAYVGTVFGPFGSGQRALRRLGLLGIPIVNVENACASGSTAFHEAFWSIRTGRFKRVLALGLEHLTSRFDGPIAPEATDAEGRSGLSLPALYAMSAARYMACHGLTDRQLAAVTVKNRQHASTNERAQFRTPVTLEQVLSSPMIADPLTLLQCCPLSDGAAAAVLGARRDNPRDVAVLSCVLRSGHLWDYRSKHVWGQDLVSTTAAQAYKHAGITPDEIDVLEVHDAFTIGEIVTLEALGLAALGEGGRLAESGVTALGGTHPVNPSGGLISRGHPLGATGLAQLAEIVGQLRGDQSTRQVQNARIGLVETMGGGVSGIDGNACVITVLSGAAQ